ncbi:hypothetical protein MCERE19_02653 [Spirosomataceae bacterium]|jgi:hypothetical protein
MKKVALLLLSVFVVCCNSNKNEQSSSAEQILPEIKLDSIGIENFFADITLKNISASKIKNLTQNLSDTSLFAGIDDGFLRLDSIKKAGGYENYLSKLDIGMYKDIRAVHFKDINLSKAVSLKLWGFDYSSYEACPYSNGKVVFISKFVDGKNVECIPFSYFNNWSDAPFYESFRTLSVLTKDGFIVIKEFNSNGGLDVNDKEYVNRSTNIIRRSIIGSF